LNSSKNNFENKTVRAKPSQKGNPSEIIGNMKTLSYSSGRVTPEELDKLEKECPQRWSRGDVILGLYEVVKILGERGFFRTCKVFHRTWNSFFTVKSLLPDLADTEEKKNNFIKECNNLAALRLHPNIAGFYYVRKPGGIPAVFLDYIDGQNILDYFKTRKRSLKEILDIAIQFLDGLSQGHDRGLIHRNIKPSNCFVTEEGILKITDFGLLFALQASGFSSENKSSSLISMIKGGAAGTPLYMSPEQWEGELIGPASDIYSFGLLLYEIFCGFNPFYESGKSSVVMKVRHLTIDPEEPGRINKDIPESLSEFILRCLKKKAEERYPGAMEARKDLVKIYEEVTGESYDRVLPGEEELRCHILNNRALSLLDTGKSREAMMLWEKILALNHYHIEANYNYFLFLWRSGRMSDINFLSRLKKIRYVHKKHWKGYYLLALVNRERSDIETVMNFLHNIEEKDCEGEDLSLLRDMKHLSSQSPHCVRTFQDHSDEVTSVYLSDDGKWLLSGSSDKTLKLWDVAMTKCIRTFEGHSSEISSVVLGEGGRRALSACYDKTLKLWNIDTGQCVQTFEGHTDCVTCVSVTGGGSHILSGSMDGTLKLWDMEKGSCIKTFEGHSDGVSSVFISEHEKFIVSGSFDKTLKLWDIEKGEAIRTFTGHNDCISSVFINEREKFILSGSFDRTIKLWDMDRGECLRTFKGHTDRVTSLSLSRDTSRILSGSYDGTLILWNRETGQCLRTLKGHTDKIRSVLLNNYWAVSGSSDRTVKLWNMELLFQEISAPFLLSRVKSQKKSCTDQIKFTGLLNLARGEMDEGNYSEIMDILSEIRALPGYEIEKDVMDLWNRAGSYMVRIGLRGMWTVMTREGYSPLVNSLAMSSDGKFIVAGREDKTLELLKVSTGSRLRSFTGHEGVVNSVVFNRHGSFVLSGSDDNTVRLWDFFSGKCLRVFEGHCDYVRSIAFSPDERWILSGSYDKTMKLWELDTGRCLITFEGHEDGINSVSFSENGAMALSGSQDNTVKLFNIVEGKSVEMFKGHAGAVTSLAFRKDGKRFISGSADNTLRIWDISTGRCIRTFRGHSGPVNSFALTGCGKWLLSGSSDATIRLWEVSTGNCIQVIEGHKEGVTSITLTPDGRWLLSRSSDKTLKLWELDWDFEYREFAHWDEGARAFMENFLDCHTPYAGLLPEKKTPSSGKIMKALKRKGRPVWNNKDFEMFLQTLRQGGYGWLKPEGVKDELEKSAAYRDKPLPVSIDYSDGEPAVEASYKTRLLKSDGVYETRRLKLEDAYETRRLKLEDIIENPLSENYIYDAPGQKELVELEKAVPSKWKKGDRILDIYEVMDLIEEDSLSKIYKILHLKWNIFLMVRAFRPDVIDGEKEKDSLIEECNRWRDMGIHPNILTLYYVRKLAGNPVLFTEYVEGFTLSDYIKSNEKKNLKEILDFSIQCLDGLSRAHEKGLVHGDIKPSSCLISKRGILKISDFCIFSCIPRSRNLSLVKPDAGGTSASYMSPEKWKGEPDDTGPWSDIYSLGIILYEMCCATHPMVLKARHLTPEPKDPSEVNPEIPSCLSRFILKCIKKNREERFQTCGEARKDLLSIYEEITGEAYYRTCPEDIELQADTLNNRGVAFMDMGKIEEAVNLWKEALFLKPDHMRSNYNYSLVMWRCGKSDDREILSRLEEIGAKNLKDKFLTGFIHMERIDSQRAIDLFDDRERGKDSGEVEFALKKAREFLPYTGSYGKSFRENPDQVIAVALSSDRKRILSSSSDRQVRLWDVETGECIYPFKENYSMVSSVTFSEDGLWAVSGSFARLLKLWSISTGRCIRTFEGHTAEITSVSLSSDGRWALSGSLDGTIKLWMVSSGKCIKTLTGHRLGVSSVAISHDGRWALSGSLDKTLKFWEIETGRPIRTFEGHGGEVSSVALSFDVRFALSGSHDKTMKFWEMTSGMCIRTFTGHTQEISSVSLSKDCLVALSGSYDRTLKLWHVQTGRCLRTFEGHEKGISAVAMSKDGMVGVSGSSDYTLRLWDFSLFLSKEPFYQAPFVLCHVKDEDEDIVNVKFKELLGHARKASDSGDYEKAMSYLSEARTLPGYELAKEALDLWNAAGASMVRKDFKKGWLNHTLAGHTSGIKSVSFSSDSHFILSGSYDKTLKLWNRETGECVRTFEGHKGSITSASITSDGKWIVSGSYDMTLRLWERDTGKTIRIFEGHTAPVSSLYLSPDHDFILSGSDDHTLKLWKTVSGRCIRTFDEHTSEIFSVILSSDCRYALSTSCDVRFHLWDVHTGKCIREFKGHRGLVSSLSLSADNKFVLSGSFDKTLKLWEVSTGKCVKTFEGHSGEVSSVALSGDAFHGISGSYDRTLRLWDISGGHCLSVFEGHSDDIEDVFMSNDLRWLLSGSKDKTLRLWELEWVFIPREEKPVLSRIFGFFKK